MTNETILEAVAEGLREEGLIVHISENAAIIHTAVYDFRLSVHNGWVNLQMWEFALDDPQVFKQVHRFVVNFVNSLVNRQRLDD